MTLATEESLPYDFLILATGMLHPKTGEEGSTGDREGRKAP